VNQQIIEKEDRLNYVLGVAYEPDVTDLQGDYMDADTVRKVAWDFMDRLTGRDKEEVDKAFIEELTEAYENNEDVYIDMEKLSEVANELEKNVGDMHDETGDHIGRIVESYIAPSDMEINGENIRKGTWLVGVVFSDPYYQKVLRGEWTGLSIGGYIQAAMEE